DIETSSLHTDQSSQLYAISFYADDLQLVLMQGKGEDTPRLRFYADEPSLLKALLQVLHEYDPDAILGWNLVQFDFSFLLAKFRQYQIPFALGRDGSELKLRPNYNNPEQVQAVLAGRVILDGISQLKNATYQLDSFALNDVAEYFLQDHKLLQSDDLGQDIEQLFHTDKAQLAAYNLKDSELVWRIFQQADLLNFAIERSSLTGLLMGRVGGSVAAFENLYLPRLHRAGYVAPNSEDGLFADTPGGYVMDSTAGFYQHVLVLDFKSLYPSIMRTFGIDPMGLVEGLRTSKTERVPGFLGGQFHRTLHLLPDILTELTQSREAAKLNGNKALSQAIKIIMASCYGVLGSGGCRFHDSRLAGSITLRGHEIIQRSAKWVQAQGYDVIYGDTDSLFIWLKNSVADEQIDQVGNSLRTGLNLFWQTQLKQHFGLTSYLEIEYETHYRRFFMPAIRGTQEGSKKRYAGLKADRLIFKGLEAVRSDWTELAKNFQRELYRRIFYDEPYHQWLTEQVQALLLGHKDHELIYQKRLGQALSAYQKQVPPHARAAKQLNQWLRQRHLPERFCYRGGRIRYLMTLNGPEPIWPDGQSNSPIDYQHYLEKQMRPLADAILQVRGEDFASLAMPQLNLF
ncbi:MAG: DNA polymerase II, partial [Venatoribacter sp.]